MWSTEIEYVLQNRKEFLGCFPSDSLPPFPTQFPKSMIINTDKATKAGEHWLGLVLTENKCFYFDSYGLFIFNTNIIKYLQPFYKIISYSNISIQHATSTLCGEFCIGFIKHVKSKITYEKFLLKFDQLNLINNNIIIQNMISKMK